MGQPADLAEFSCMTFVAAGRGASIPFDIDCYPFFLPQSYDSAGWLHPLDSDGRLHEPVRLVECRNLRLQASSAARTTLTPFVRRETVNLPENEHHLFNLAVDRAPNRNGHRKAVESVLSVRGFICQPGSVAIAFPNRSECMQVDLAGPYCVLSHIIHSPLFTRWKCSR